MGSKTQANDKSRELKGGYTYFYVSIGVRNVDWYIPIMFLPKA